MCREPLSEAQSRCGALGYGLAHPLAVGLGTFRLQDRHAAVVLHLEHVLGDRLADAVAGALAEVDFYPHDVSDPIWAIECAPERV